MVLAQTPDVSAFIDNPPVALLIILLIAAIGTLASGKIVVPRFFYDREKEGHDASRKQVSELTEVVKEYNDELRELRRGPFRDA